MTVMASLALVNARFPSHVGSKNFSSAPRGLGSGVLAACPPQAYVSSVLPA